MYRCSLCRWLVELDDVEIFGRFQVIICTTCYARLSESEHRMPKELRQALITVLAEVPN